MLFGIDDHISQIFKPRFSYAFFNKSPSAQKRNATSFLQLLSESSIQEPTAVECLKSRGRKKKENKNTLQRAFLVLSECKISDLLLYGKLLKYICEEDKFPSIFVRTLPISTSAMECDISNFCKLLR